MPHNVHLTVFVAIYSYIQLYNLLQGVNIFCCEGSQLQLYIAIAIVSYLYIVLKSEDNYNKAGCGVYHIQTYWSYRWTKEWALYNSYVQQLVCYLYKISSQLATYFAFYCQVGPHLQTSTIDIAIQLQLNYLDMTQTFNRSCAHQLPIKKVTQIVWVI